MLFEIVQYIFGEYCC